jgi:predicted ATPase/class 3 adenylate cyclase
VPDLPRAVTFLFTDIEGSTRLWEQQPERMQPALARHDAISRVAVEAHRGVVVKTTGDGVHAAFDRPTDALAAMLQMQRTLSDPTSTDGVELRLRCGLHLGADERRDNDFYGPAVNRAARIMSVAHGGQMLVSQAVAERITGELPAGVVLRDLGRVRLRDLTSPERIHQVVHPALRADFPPLRSLEATPNNLPQQLNSFIGREGDLVKVKQLLTDHRLVTLLGIGGIGKSRLSLQLAADAMDDYPDGVWLVELAPLADARLVPQALATVLGVKEEAGHPVIEALVKHVRDRQLLVILDNCEHVVLACAELAKRLLQAGPQLKMFASSREALKVAGEMAYQVPTLSAPDPQGKVALETLIRHDAVRLFIERATAAQPALHVNDRNAVAVADICHRLDGIPLAIELAAARTRALSVEAIAARLSDRFRLLSTTDQTVLPRQRTLRALIDWSYDLLTEDERAVFQRLAVFAGGWTLEAAEAVGASGKVAEQDVLELLTGLVEKSLVAMDAEGGRYRLLETVRQYAHERSSEAGEHDAARARQLAFYLALTEQARLELHGPEQVTWLKRLDLERENVLAAHAWCDCAPDGAELGLRLVFAVKPYWVNRGLLGLGLRVTVEALARAGAQERAFARCRGLGDAGQFCCFMGRYVEAQGYLQESLAIAREIGDKQSVAGVLQPLGMASLGQGDTESAGLYFEEAVDLARELADNRELAAAIIALAQLHRVEGHLDLAEPLYGNALALARELGDQEIVAIGLLNLAMVSIGRASGERAAPMLLEVMAIAKDIGSQPAGQCALEVCAGLCASLEQWKQGARLYGAAEAQAERSGLQRDAVDEAFLTPLMAKIRIAMTDDEYAVAESAGRGMAYDEALLEARAWLENGRRPFGSANG